MAEANDPDRDDERRNKPRKSTRIRAWADPGGVCAPADCVIVDISEGGARIASVGERDLPENFTLLNDAKSTFGEATVMWRAENMVGVKFENAAPIAAKTVNIRVEIGAAPRVGHRKGKSGV